MWTKYDSTHLPIAGSGPGYQLTSITYLLTGSTTYATPVGCRAIIVECIAPGGAGGSVSTAASSAAAGGGGGGAYARKLIKNPAATYAVSVPAGAAAGATGNNPGNTGGNTVFGASLAVASGGTGGSADTGTTTLHPGGSGGAGGATAGCVGDLLIPGQPGGIGFTLTTAACISGWGGMTAHGFGAGAAPVKSATSAGNAGAPFGGGGSGGALISSGASQAGGAGGAGLIIVWEFA